MIRLVIRSSSEEEREKFRNYSRIPAAAGRTDMYFLGSAVVEELGGFPKLGSADDGIIDEKQFFVPDQPSTGISFIFAMRFLWLWVVGMKDRGQVGVYLIKGRAKGMPDSLA